MTEDEKAFFTQMIETLNNKMGDLLDRLTAVDGEVRNLRSEHSVTRDLVAALPATVLSAVEKALLNRMTAAESRLTKLERKPEGG